VQNLPAGTNASNPLNTALRMAFVTTRFSNFENYLRNSKMKENINAKLILFVVSI
jgi:hypothetical protein